MIPLLPDLARHLNEFAKDKSPDENVFELTGAGIGNKIRLFARKAGLSNIHTHSLRHKYATDLLEGGVNIRIVHELLGHRDISTIQGYLAITDQGLRDAVGVLGKKRKTSRGIGVEESEIYESKIDITLTPAPWDPLKSTIIEKAIAIFVMELESDEILIESLQVRTSDTELPYQLLLFETDPRRLSGDLEEEDLVQMNPVKQRTYTFPVGGNIPYKNRDKSSMLYGGLCIGQRPLLLDLLADNTGEKHELYPQNPVDFSIILRYRTRRQ